MCLLGAILVITMCLASINLGAGAAEGWVPDDSGSKIDKQPLLVEWDGHQMTIHGASRQCIELGEQVQDWFNEERSLGSTELQAFIDKVANETTHYVLFAVRPSGFENFQTLAAEFREREVDIGYERIEQGKVVRLKTSDSREPPL